MNTLQVRRALSAFAIATATFVSLSGGTVSGASTPTWSNAQPAVYASGAEAPSLSPGDEFTAIDCAGLTCVAAGYLTNPSSDVLAMTDTSTDGGLTWGTAHVATFPSATELPSNSPGDRFSAVSCSGTHCVAAGSFSTTGGNREAMTDTSTDGGLTWETVHVATYAVGVENTTPGASFDSVSCSNLTCVAVGAFRTVAGTSAAMTETSTDGGVTWGNAQQPNFGSVPHSGPSDVFTGVSCTANSCVAVGQYLDNLGNDRAMTETSSDGGVTWSPIVSASYPSGVHSTVPSDEFTSVSCWGTTCVAAGYFVDAGQNTEAMTSTSSNSGATWSVSSPATYPAGVHNASPYDYFLSVTCTAVSCVAVGAFQDQSSSSELMTETSFDGGVTWGEAAPVQWTVASVSGGELSSVSCDGLKCAAAGTTYISGQPHAVAITSIDGGATWSVGTPASFDPSLHKSWYYDRYDAVACAGLRCVAAGEFVTSDFKQEAMTSTSLLASAPSSVANLTVSPNASTLSANWSTSSGATSYTCTLFYGYNNPSTFAETVTGTTCSFSGLAAGNGWGISVVATGDGGTSPAVSAFGAITPSTPSTPSSSGSGSGKSAHPAVNVYFANNSTALTSIARSHLSSYANTIRRDGLHRLVVTAYADPNGSTGANQALSRGRASRVATFLRQNFAYHGYSVTVVTHGAGVLASYTNLAQDRVAIVTS